MYCKHCGKEIDDNSTFCKHCGKLQGNTLKGILDKPVWIIYIIWTLANLYLLMGDKFFDAFRYWYPSSGKKCFDISEFIVYVFIIPALLFVIYRRYNEKIDKFVDKLLNKK